MASKATPSRAALIVLAPLVASATVPAAAPIPSVATVVARDAGARLFASTT